MLLLKLDNRAQEITLKDRRGELMDFLRSELRNSSIQMETELAEVQGQTKAYTSTERFQAMTSKNPSLKSLKETLDLEIDL